MPLRLPCMQPYMYSTGVSFRGRQLSLSQSLLTASCVLQLPAPTLICAQPPSVSKITPQSGTKLFWTEVFDPCEPFQPPLCVSKLMSLLRSDHITSAACRTVFDEVS